MKKTPLLILVTLFFSSTAFAQAPSAPKRSDAPPGHEKQTPQRFEEVKAKRLEAISKHLAKVKQHQACVEAAANFEALHACRPERKER